MIGASCRLTTSRGLHRAGELQGSPRLWTGTEWAAAAVGPPVRSDLLAVGTKDGRSTLVSAATRVWAATLDGYEVRLPGELRAGDFLLAPLGTSDALPAVAPLSTAPYWLGVLAASGRRDHGHDGPITAFVRVPRTAITYDTICRFAIRRGFRARCIAQGARVAVIFQGSRLGALSMAWGLQLELGPHVPWSVWGLSCGERRTFCRGLLDSVKAPPTDARYWVLSAATQTDARDLHQLFTDAGASPIHAEGGTVIHIPRWLASAQLGVPGPRPTLADIASGRITAPVEQAFLGHPRLEEMTTLRVPQTAARQLRKGKRMHPAYLRAAWRALRRSAPIDIFDTLEVTSVRTTSETTAVEVRVDDNAWHRFAADGLLVEDDR